MSKGTMPWSVSHADPRGPIEQHMYIQWVQIVVDHVEDPNEYCFGTQGKVVEFYIVFFDPCLGHWFQTAWDKHEVLYLILLVSFPVP